MFMMTSARTFLSHVIPLSHLVNAGFSCAYYVLIPTYFVRALWQTIAGGTNNAFTDSEKTVYYFEVDASIDARFAEALSRFGSFFSGPLFSESATGRELNAIDSENSKNLQNDVFRLYELEKGRVNGDHP